MDMRHVRALIAGVKRRRWNLLPLLAFLFAGGLAVRGQTPDPNEAVITNRQADIKIRRDAVLAMLKTETGARRLIERAAQTNGLPVDLQWLAALELGNLANTNLRAQAAAVLPPYLAKNSEPMPPLEELLRRRGDPANGAKVFLSPDANCVNCHVVKKEGVSNGPDLSGIGLILDRTGLLESILDPNAQITKDYETWYVTLKNEDEYAGILAAETPQEISLRDLRGTVNKLKKSDIVKRQQLSVSIMPVGLQQAMTVQELVDVVAYLETLREPPPKP